MAYSPTPTSTSVMSLILLAGTSLGSVFGAPTLAYALSTGSTSTKPAQVVLSLLATGLAVVTVFLTRAHAVRESDGRAGSEPSAVSAILLVTSIFAVTYGALQLLASVAA
jgi:hypothetical protein